MGPENVSQREIPMQYVLALGEIAKALKSVLTQEVYGEYLSIATVTLFDTANGDESEFGLDYHDDELWLTVKEN